MSPLHPALLERLLDLRDYGGHSDGIDEFLPAGLVDHDQCDCCVYATMAYLTDEGRAAVAGVE